MKTKMLILKSLLKERQTNLKHLPIRQRLKRLVVCASGQMLPFVIHKRRPSESCSSVSLDCAHLVPGFFP